ncbi:MAG: hypothetical protein WC514_01605 [Candidatus Paceibacterota bacterium]
MGQNICNTFKGGRFKLDLLVTSLEWSAPLIGEGDIIHLLHTDYPSEIETRFYLFSVDPFAKKSWGPYPCGDLYLLLQSEVSDLVHAFGYRKTVRGDKDLKGKEPELLQNDLTRFVRGLLFKEYKVTWDLLNETRIERINNRVSNPRTVRNQKFKDDPIDMSLSRMISKVNAIMNEQLFWGAPVQDDCFLNFYLYQYLIARDPLE